MKTTLLVCCTLLTLGRAEATECGALRLEAAHFKAAGSSVKDAAAKQRAAEKKMATACAPKKATVAALPLGYLSVPPGNLSKAILDLPAVDGDGGPMLTTRAGAAGGIVFADHAKLSTPAVHVESTLSPDRALGEVLVIVALGASLTVEEPVAGKGTWQISVEAAPAIIPLAKIRSCAAGKDKSLKLTATVCRELLVVDPTPQPSSLFERGRGRLIGEWQWGWHAGFDLGADELVPPPRQAPRPAVAMTLELSAPLPGISDGNKLVVAIEDHPRDKVAGLTWKLGQGCGDDDDRCEKQRFAAEVWFDDAFGVPLLRPPAAPPSPGALVGKVADRLARPLAGQRLQCSSGGRNIIVLSDAEGAYRCDGMQAGDGIVLPVGKLPGVIAKADQKSIKVGAAETNVPIIYENKVLE